MIRTLPLALGALLVCAGAANAQTPLTYADVDSDGSGELSLPELQAVWTNFTQSEFDAADSDTNGGISVRELDALQAAAAPAADALSGTPAQ
jgi:hypothetical protein